MMGAFGNFGAEAMEIEKSTSETAIKADTMLVDQLTLPANAIRNSTL